MTQTLYSLRSINETEWNITKFLDGEVEGSYRVSHTECECPAGVRPSCRHRQMLPQMLAHGLMNTHWFWDFDRGYACDFQGGSKQLADQCAQLAEVPAEEETKLRPHSTAVSAPDFDSGDTGSNPVVAAKPAWRRM